MFDRFIGCACDLLRCFFFSFGEYLSDFSILGKKEANFLLQNFGEECVKVGQIRTKSIKEKQGGQIERGRGQKFAQRRNLLFKVRHPKRAKKAKNEFKSHPNGFKKSSNPFKTG